jgi:predicted ABC-class ATPase
MSTIRDLRGKLKGLDARDYGAYQSLRGEYSFEKFTLKITQIPKDPYAPPHTGIYRIVVPHEVSGITAELYSTRIRQIALRDFLARRFALAAAQISQGRRGTGHSGLITLDRPSQAILERSVAVLGEIAAEVRFFIGLPANGRKINARTAEAMLFEELPAIVDQSLESLDIDDVRLHLNTAEDCEHLRSQLDGCGLVAFVADGAVLPRESGASEHPLEKSRAVVFRSPESLRVGFELPHAGRVTGMGIPQGVTLIVGGGYHGKSTLLHAIERGIYNHIPGDGRELCAAHPLTVKVRAYSGRDVKAVDISTFIRNLPHDEDTTSFSTPNASGSTSQAAHIMEALESGACVLLLDEDTCATNFMIRDSKMQELVQKHDEPITTFIDRVRRLYTDQGVSSIVVLGGTGDYFQVADTVIQMVRYAPRDVTEAAHRIANESPGNRSSEDSGYPVRIPKRRLHTGSIDPNNEYGKRSVYAKEVRRIHFGRTDIDLADVEQLIDLSQTRAIAQAIECIRKRGGETVSFTEAIDGLMREIDEKGLDILSEKISGHFAGFRGIELASAFNRLRGVQMTPG